MLHQFYHTFRMCLSSDTKSQSNRTDLQSLMVSSICQRDSFLSFIQRGLLYQCSLKRKEKEMESGWMRRGKVNKEKGVGKKNCCEVKRLFWERNWLLNLAAGAVFHAGCHEDVGCLHLSVNLPTHFCITSAVVLDLKTKPENVTAPNNRRLRFGTFHFTWHEGTLK